MDELSYLEITRLAGDDPLRRWVAQDLTPPTRAWRSSDGRAAAIARPALAQRDRVLILGERSAAAGLLRELLAVLGPTYRPFGDRRLLDHLIADLPELERRGEFSWMWCSSAEPATWAAEPSTWAAQPATWAAQSAGAPPAGWAGPEDEEAIAALLARNFSSSYAQPGRAGVQRWARIAIGDRIVAAGAWAWSQATVGLISGVTVDAEMRGRGLGRAIASFLLREALRTFGTAGLLADDDNTPAVALYRSLGLRPVPLLAARIRAERLNSFMHAYKENP